VTRPVLHEVCAEQHVLQAELESHSACLTIFKSLIITLISNVMPVADFILAEG
jgi:hypothetical protein